MLIDGPGADRIVDAGDPPARRAIFVLDNDGFSETAYRYYLTRVDGDRAAYTYGGEVQWPPEAASEVIKRVHGEM